MTTAFVPEYSDSSSEDEQSKYQQSSQQHQSNVNYNKTQQKHSHNNNYNETQQIKNKQNNYNQNKQVSPINTSKYSNQRSHTNNYSNIYKDVEYSSEDDEAPPCHNPSKSTISNQQNPSSSHNIASQLEVKQSQIKSESKHALNPYANVTYSDEDDDDDEQPPNNQPKQPQIPKYPIQSNIHYTKENNLNNDFNNLHIDNNEQQQKHRYQEKQTKGNINNDNNNNQYKTQESESNIYPKLFHARFKQNGWNPWNPQSWKDKKAYGVVNKPGGPGIDGDRPHIINKTYQGNRGNRGGYNNRYNNNNGYGRGRGRGRGIRNNDYNNYSNNKKCILCGDPSHFARNCPTNNNGGYSGRGRGRERGRGYGNNNNNYSGY